MKKRTVALTLCLCACLCLAGCGKNKSNENTPSGYETSADGDIIYTDQNGNKHNVTFDDGSDTATAVEIPEADFEQSVSQGTYDGTVDAAVTLLGSSATVDGSGVQTDGNTVTFTAQGMYLVSGELQGQIIVDTPDTEKVKLILNGVSVTCESGPALQVNTAAKKVILYSAKDSVNLFSDGTDYYTEAEDGTSSGLPNACIWSAEDLKFDGLGSIYITGNCDKGVNTKDDLEICSGTLYVSAKGAALRGNDSVTISGGYLHATSTAGDGIKTSNTDQGKGDLVISGGEVYIDCFGDGISASAALTVSGGTISISTEGTVDASSSSSSSSGSGWGGSGGGRPGGGGHGGGPGGMNEGNSNKSSTSAKGLKSVGLLHITGGNITIDSADDAIHSDSAVQIDKGNLYLSANDDGIHGEQSALINGGVIEIAKSYEGIEAIDITVNGGTIRLVASDDGFNACGGTSMMGGGFFGPGQSSDSSSSSSSDETPLLTFNGGYTVVNAGGDGIDSNGQIVVTGGTVIVYGPTDNGNGPIDHGDARTDQLTISGGTLLAIGSSGMADTAVGQNYGVIAFATRSSFAAGTTMGIFDADGNLVLAFESPKAFASVVYSSADVQSGKTYSIGYNGTLDGTLQDGICSSGTFTDYTELGEIQAE
ncbi:MAG: carbohydrate-binding domain-containing protein [Clostridia bacterium]|nr:carbohydrate-binding domain-containing protein [Clostridia bacterium]